MSDSIVTIFRSKHRNHRIKSGGMDIRFVGNVYRASIPGEVALLRERAEQPNSPIREVKPDERVTVKVERAPVAPPKRKPIAELDVPETKPEK